MATAHEIILERVRAECWWFDLYVEFLVWANRRGWQG